MSTRLPSATAFDAGQGYLEQSSTISCSVTSVFDLVAHGQLGG